LRPVLFLLIEKLSTRLDPFPLDDLCGLLFRTSDERVAGLLLDPSYPLPTDDLPGRLVSFIENEGFLMLLSQLIHLHKDGVDNATLGFPSARFADPASLLNVEAISLASSLKPRVPHDCAADQLRGRVTSRLGRIPASMQFDPPLFAVADRPTVHFFMSHTSTVRPVDWRCLPSRRIRDDRGQLVAQLARPEFVAQALDILCEIPLDPDIPIENTRKA
jgi:hypothetical protein